MKILGQNAVIATNISATVEIFSDLNNGVFVNKGVTLCLKNSIRY